MYQSDPETNTCTGTKRKIGNIGEGNLQTV